MDMKDVFIKIPHETARKLLEGCGTDRHNVVHEGEWVRDMNYGCDYKKVVFEKDGRYWMLCAERDEKDTSFFDYLINEWDDVGDKNEVTCLEVIKRPITEADEETDEHLHN